MTSAPMRRIVLLALTMLAAGAVASGTSAATLRVLHSFCQDAPCSEGLEPAAGLVADQSGNLYGTTSEGGASGNGAVFELTKAGNKNWSFQTIYSFCTTSGCPDGNEPRAPVIVDTQGNIYGTAFFGGSGKGVVFEIERDPQAGFTYQVLYAFCQQTNCADGSGPQTSLGYAGNNTGAFYDGVSPLYGTTSAGGSNNAGITFRLLPPSGKRKAWREAVIHNFCSKAGAACRDGTVPRATLTVDSSEDVFGTTSGGGRNTGVRGGPGGVLFELTPNARKSKWSETVLHAFCRRPNCSDGKAVGS